MPLCLLVIANNENMSAPLATEAGCQTCWRSGLLLVSIA